MKKIPNSKTPKSMPLILAKFALKKTFRKVSSNRNVRLYLYQLAFYTDLKKSNKIQFPQQEKPNKNLI